MSIAQFLDRSALEPLDPKGHSTTFARGVIDRIAYKLPGDEDFSYITAETEDDEIDQLAEHLASVATGSIPPVGQIAEHLKQVRDDTQLATSQGDA